MTTATPTPLLDRLQAIQQRRQQTRRSVILIAAFLALSLASAVTAAEPPALTIAVYGASSDALVTSTVIHEPPRDAILAAVIAEQRPGCYVALVIGDTEPPLASIASGAEQAYAGRDLQWVWFGCVEPAAVPQPTPTPVVPDTSLAVPS